MESSLALANLQLGRLSDANTHFQQAAECLRLQQGDAWPSGESALRLLYGLAVTYHKERDTDRAAETLKSVLELALRTFDEFDNRTIEINARFKAVADLAELNIRHHKAVLLASAAGNSLKPRLESPGQLNEAEAMDVHTPQGYEAGPGSSHTSTLETADNLGLLHNNQAQWDKAETQFVVMMEICKAELGEDHPDTLTSMANLASIYRKQGRWDEAETLEVQVMETRKTKLGADHLHTLTSMNNLAFTWKSLGRHKDALALMKSCVLARQRVLGHNHPYTLSSKAALDTWIS